MTELRPARFTAVVGSDERSVEAVPLDGRRWRVTVDDRVHLVDGQPTGKASWSLLIGGRSIELSLVARGDTWTVDLEGQPWRVRLLDEHALRRRARAGEGAGARELRAVMPGKVVAVLVEAGATVAQGQGLLVIEAMKMENEIGAPRAGTVIDVKVQPGQAVEAGELLAVID